MSDDKKVVFLAFTNPHMEVETISRLSCNACKNKTFTLTYSDDGFPTLACACCGGQHGQIGWVNDGSEQ